MSDLEAEEIRRTLTHLAGRLTEAETRLACVAARLRQAETRLARDEPQLAHMSVRLRDVEDRLAAASLYSFGHAPPGVEEIMVTEVVNGETRTRVGCVVVRKEKESDPTPGEPQSIPTDPKTAAGETWRDRESML